jgi:hypothetical protein
MLLSGGEAMDLLKARYAATCHDTLMPPRYAAYDSTGACAEERRAA